MALQRLTGAADHESDVHPYPPAVERVCRALLACERMALRLGARLPFGGSVLVVAKRSDE
jgi:hypothetical protein